MNVERLKININGVPSKGINEPILFDEVSALIGSKLPQDYITFISLADGGHPEIGTFYVKNNGHESVFDIDWFYSIENLGIVSVKEALNDWGRFLGKNCLPVARDGGGNQIYLDIGKEASVWLYLHDGQMQDRFKLSNSLNSFIDSLVQNPDFI